MMKKLFKIFMLLICVIGVLCPEVANAEVLKVHALNNLSDIDYKISKDRLNEIWDEYPTSSSSEFEIVFDSDEKVLGSVSELDDDYLIAAKSWLIDHDIYSRMNNESWTADEKVARQSDLWMMLYKSKFGVIESRPVLYADGNSRSFFVAPDVYELYLSALYDKGILLKSSLNQDCALLDSLGSGYGDLNPDLGYSNSVDVLGLTYNGDYDKRVAPTFFAGTSGSDDATTGSKKDEHMTMLEALHIIARFMRFTDKDMTDTEANIVMYKYGITYMSNLTDSESSDVAYLIAKGIINVEDSSFNLNELSVTNADIYKLIYRVANPDARYDFSEIQLTDSDNFWQVKGYSADTFTLYFVDDRYVNQTISNKVISKSSTVASVPKTFFTRMFGVSAAKSTKKTYKIIKEFDTVNTYSINGVPLTSGISLSELQEAWECVTDIQTTKSKTATDANGKKLKVYRVTFEVPALSKDRALRYVESRITVSLEDSSQTIVSGVTKITADGEVTTMISQETLRECFSDKIEIVADKILKNTDSGTLAYLSADSGYALVGNQVIKGDETYVARTNTEIYYNLDIISSLVGTSIMNMFNGFGGRDKVAAIQKYSTVKVQHKYAGENSSFNTKAEYACANYTENDSGTGSLEMLLEHGEGIVTSNCNYYYNVNQISSGINTVWRDFAYDFDDDGTVETFTVLVDWLYAVPDLDDYKTLDIQKTLYNSDQYTLNEIISALYEEPSDANLKVWWQSNIGMSNALANMLFSTKNVEYIKTGYLVPQLTVLMPEEYTQFKSKQTNSSKFGTSDSSIISRLLCDNGFSISTTYKSFVNDSTTNWVKSYFSLQAGISNTQLKSFAANNRKAAVYTADNSNVDKCVHWSGQYIRTAYGILFRNLKSDTDRMSFATKAGGELSRIVIDDRTSSLFESPSVGTEVVNKSVDITGITKFVYLGVANIASSSESKMKAGRYLKIAAPFMQSGREVPQFSEDPFEFNYNTTMPMFSRTQPYNGGPYVMKELSSNADIYSTLGSLYQNYYGLDMSKVFPNTAEFEGRVSVLSHTFQLSDALAKENYADSDCYYAFYDSSNVSGTTLDRLVPYKMEGNTWKKLPNLIASGETANKEADVAIGQKIYSMPIFYLPAGSYYLKASKKKSSEYEIHAGFTNYALHQSAIFYSGILDSAIDAQIAKELGTTEVKNLQEGTTLQIGDIHWVKSGDYWVSEPIASTSIASTAFTKAKAWKDTNSDLDMREGVSSLYKSFVVYADGVTTVFPNYIEECTLGYPGALNLTSAENCIYADADGVPVLDYYSGKEKKHVQRSARNGFPKGKTATCVVLKMKLNDTMLVVPTSADGSSYRFCSSATESVVSGTNYNFFDESSFFESSVKDRLDLSVSSFEMSAAYNSAKDQFYSEFKELNRNEIIRLIKIWIMIIASWLIVIGWLIYWAFSRGAFLRVLEGLAGLSRTGETKGIDVVKILSLGIYNINSPPDFKRLATVTLVSLAVVVVCFVSL